MITYVNRSLQDSSEGFSRYAKVYDPIKIGSIDGTDVEPHDRAIVRAINSDYYPNRHVKGKPQCTIFVARLNHKTTKDTIKDIFSKYGKINRFRMVKDIVTGTPKGYAFIEYETEHAAEEAYRKANKMVVDDRELFIDFECQRLLKGWRPRRLGGGFGGKKESGQLRFGGRDRPFKPPIVMNRRSVESTRSDRDEHRNRDYKKRERDRDDKYDNKRDKRH